MAQLGFVAQDLQRVFPTLVSSIGDRQIQHSDGTVETVPKALGVNYTGLIAPLVKAVQELKADNDNLRREFEVYKAAHP